MQISRRNLLPAIGAGLSWPGIAPAAQSAQAAARLKITDLECIKVQGHRETETGVDHQFQVNPLHIYDDLRPPEYHDGKEGRATVPTSALYLKARTDAGLDGLYGPIDREAAVVIDQQLRPFLKGKDALAGEMIWDQMHRSNRHSRHGYFMMAISAVDNALWDLRGRFYNAPVYRLLGGPTRSSIEIYGSCLGFSLEPEKVRMRAAALKDSGYRNQKWFLAHGPGEGPEGLAKNVELVRIVRETVGPDVNLMFDAYQGWSLDYAIAWAKQVEQYRPRWIEEAFPMDKLEAFVALRRATSIPIATGEHFYGRWEVNEFLKAGAISVVQADPEWCGGVSELVKICAVASLFDAQVVPHGHSLHAALHVIVSQSPGVCPMAEHLITKMRSYYHFERSPLEPVRARITLSGRPGFGIELDPAKVEKQTVVHWSD